MFSYTLVPIIVVSALVCLALTVIVKRINFDKTTGVYGLFIKVDIGRKRMYAWYKKGILGSTSFNLDTSIEEIQKKKQKLKEESLLKIKRIKEIKSKV